MSNKRLIGIIIALLVVGGGVYAYYQYSQQNKIINEQPGQSSADAQTPPGSVQLGQQASPSPATQPLASTTPPAAPTTTTTSMTCTRNFDHNKLQTAKVDIANKFVTLEVKDFGTVKLQLYDKDAPKAVENFLRLANSGYYDCLTFHRVAKGFVIQGGDPNGNGTGGISAFGDKFADELDPATPSAKAGYVKGVLAMANSGPNTNGSQFFIMLGDHPELPHNYTIFGKVAAGQDIVDKIGQVDINPGPFGPTDGAPKTPVVVTKATIAAK